MNNETSSGPALAVPASTVIEPSGQTDDIRYVLNADPEKQSAHPPATPAPGNHAALAATGTSGGLANLVIDDVDAELPDRTASTIAGGQVAKESKRGAY
jgi:hypothetical protein